MTYEEFVWLYTEAVSRGDYKRAAEIAYAYNGTRR